MTTTETRWDDPRDDSPSQPAASHARMWLTNVQPSVIDVRNEVAKLEKRLLRPPKNNSGDAIRRKARQDNYDRSAMRVLKAWLSQVHGIS